MPRASKRIRVPVADPGDFVANTRRSLPPSNRLPRSAAADLLAPRAVELLGSPETGPRAARGLVGRPGRTPQAFRLVAQDGLCRVAVASGGRRDTREQVKTLLQHTRSRRRQPSFVEPVHAAWRTCPTFAPRSPEARPTPKLGKLLNHSKWLQACPTARRLLALFSQNWVYIYLPPSACGPERPTVDLSSTPGKIVGQWSSQ